MEKIIVENCVGFDWDKANIEKNQTKHGVSHLECEQIFFNRPLLINEDKHHSNCEERHYALGMTDHGRKLFVAFTVRMQLLRVISARDMSKKERGFYEKIKENTSI